MINELHAYLSATATRPAGIKTVEKAWGLEPRKDIIGIVPALYVYPGDLDVEDAGFDFTPGHTLKQRAKVDLITTMDDFETRRALVWASLLGWSESPFFTQLQLESGAVEKIEGDLVWWTDTWFNQYQIKQT